RRLNAGDQFNVIRFSTDVETLSDGLLDANDANQKRAIDFADKIEARGGTNIDGALTTALKMKRDAARPCVIVFLTDGMPTVGETDTPNILRNVKNNRGERTRFFVFGVGHDVNTHLLDEISGQNGGVSQYVKPGENLEVKVSSFYDKISSPVLSQPALAIDKIKTKDALPQPLPDLFAGGQITIFGRYEGDGHVAIRLTGEVNGEKREFVYEANFPKTNADNDFIPRLWATRRVGWLLDQIRLHGEN